MKRNKFLLIALILLQLGGALLLRADIPRVRITGKVIDGLSGDPLWYANVFLSRTSWGAATDENGFYTIENIPLGEYELVVTYVGYEMGVLPIELRNLNDQIFNFILNPKPFEAPELAVEAEVPKQWERDLRRFQRYFLGTSKFAKKCKILNPEIIDFEYNTNSKVFSASLQTTDPIEIENKSLGYKIFFDMEDFAAHGDDMVRYLGKTRFEPMEPKNDREQRRWNDNRKQVFTGSLRHFLMSSIVGTFEEQGFVAYNASSIAEPNSEEEIHFNSITPQKIYTVGSASFERNISFANYIKVMHFEGKYRPSETRSFFFSFNKRKQALARGITSAMRLTTDTVRVNILGYIYNPYSVTVYGKWAEQRMGDELPLNYMP